MPRSICVPNLKFLAAPVPNLLKGAQITNLPLPPTPLLGYFVIPEMGHAMIYLYTKFEVSTWTRSKFMKGVPKFTNLAPGPHHAPSMPWYRAALFHANAVLLHEYYNYHVIVLYPANGHKPAAPCVGTTRYRTATYGKYAAEIEHVSKSAETSKRRRTVPVRSVNAVISPFPNLLKGLKNYKFAPAPNTPPFGGTLSSLRWDIRCHCVRLERYRMVPYVV